MPFNSSKDTLKLEAQGFHRFLIQHLKYWIIPVQKLKHKVFKSSGGGAQLCLYLRRYTEIEAWVCICVYQCLPHFPSNCGVGVSDPSELSQTYHDIMINYVRLLVKVRWLVRVTLAFDYAKFFLLWVGWPHIGETLVCMLSCVSVLCV